jgi:hypothetical protein
LLKTGYLRGEDPSKILPTRGGLELSNPLSQSDVSASRDVALASGAAAG